MINEKIKHTHSIFPAKVLLFGEYSVILGGNALSIPIKKFFGKWKSQTDCCSISLLGFCDYLMSSTRLNTLLDLSKFHSDIRQGLCFNSNIPSGYGLGSSGALTAAVYDKYVLEKSLKELVQLKDIFSEMESYFHGSSSGMDPLVSYKNQLVLFEDNQKLQCFELSNPCFSYHSLFLLDSKHPRQTVPLIRQFNSWVSKNDFKQKCTSELNALNIQAIHQLLNSHSDQLFETFQNISQFQWEHMRPMICPGIEAVWEAGLHSGDFYLKLCGAGGGGMYLAMIRNDKIALLPKTFPITRIEI